MEYGFSAIIAMIADRAIMYIKNRALDGNTIEIHYPAEWEELGVVDVFEIENEEVWQVPVAVAVYFAHNPCDSVTVDTEFREVDDFPEHPSICK